MKNGVADFPKKMTIGLQDGYCNLKCPMCFIHYENAKKIIRSIRGRMLHRDIYKIVDEIEKSKPLVTPHSWSEPFVMKDFCKYLALIKERDIPIMVHTNGLLVTSKIAKELVKIELDSINFSIDAMTLQTVNKVRGLNDLDRIKDAVFGLLKIRGDKQFPRISASFVITKENKHEKDEFISYWLKYVDMVRINKQYNLDRSVNNYIVQKSRIPCAAIYDTMVVNHKGDVNICCLDSFNETNMGNVLKDGVRGVWHSDKFKEVRYYHQTGQYDKVPFCKNCVVWSRFLFKETITESVLIRESPLMTYYNRLDRLQNWTIRKPPFLPVKD